MTIFILNQQKDEAIQQLGVIERFFDSHYFNTIQKYKWLIIIIFLLQIIYPIFQTINLQISSKKDELFTNDHFITNSYLKITNDFHKGSYSQSINVDIYWGAQDINAQNTNLYDPADIGKVIWDDDFDLSSPFAQVNVYQFCQHLKSLDQLLFTQGSVDCWIEDFKNYVFSQGLIFPVYISNDVKYYYKNQQEYFNSVVLEYTLHSKKGKQYRSQNYIGIVDSKLIFMKIKAKSVGSLQDSYLQNNPIKQKWEKQIEIYNMNAPKGVNNAKQTAGIDWCIMTTEVEQIQTMKSGFIITSILSAIVILIATENIIIAFYALITISMIMVNVYAMISYFGWQLSLGESVALIICVGISADYVGIMAIYYVNSNHFSCNDKVRSTLRETSTTILSSSLSIFLSCSIMFLCAITSFIKFAILILITTAFSASYSLIFFAALCISIGPNQMNGNFYYHYQSFIEWISFQKSIYQLRRNEGDENINQYVKNKTNDINLQIDAAVKSEQTSSKSI